MRVMITAFWDGYLMITGILGTPKGPAVGRAFVGCLSGGVLLSHTLSGAVPLALVGLASGFGMGPGVSPPLWPP